MKLPPVDGCGQLEPDERRGLERTTELRRVEPAGEVGGRRREDVAAVEGARDGLEPVRRVLQLPRALDAAETVRGQHEQPVVRADVEPSVAGAESDGLPLGADTGIDDREVHALGHVREGVGEHERALQHLRRLDAVRDVDDVRVRRDALDHAVARADEVVLEPEVGEEGDDHDASLATALRIPSTS